jgi:hypothetical protein
MRTILAIVAALLFAVTASAGDLQCMHMLTDPDADGVIFSVSDSTISICTPGLSQLGNAIPSSITFSACTIDFGSGSTYNTLGPFKPASIVATPIPVAMEFDYPVTMYCTAEGLQGEVLSATARFPFSGAARPGLPR